jgi:PKHD-type hydroxylase
MHIYSSGEARCKPPPMPYTLSEAEFVDGRSSAGLWAQRVKANEELDPQSDCATRLNELVVGSLYNNAVFRSAALPQRVSAAFFARYRTGMSYGQHIDDPVMGEGERYRSDIAITVFLNPPGDYDGGALVVRTSSGEIDIKLPAGDAVIYPASSLHRVSEVIRGERLVAVAWAQSLVRDPAKRALLYDLDVARQSLRRVTPDAEVTATIDNTYANLVRMWASP